MCAWRFCLRVARCAHASRPRLPSCRCARTQPLCYCAPLRRVAPRDAALRCALLHAALRRAALRAGYVVGFAGGTRGAADGPSFSLLAQPLGRAPGSSSAQLRRSGPAALLWHSGPLNWADAPFDRAAGGHPTNYAPPVRVDTSEGGTCARLSLDVPVQLLLRFDNGGRNVHLQGGGWAREGDPPCDLRLRLRIAPMRSETAEWSMQIPTGLRNALARPPASLTARDVRSGGPRETSTVLLGAPIAPPSLSCPRAGAHEASARAVATSIVGVSLHYRYLVGYSGAKGAHGPSFRLLARNAAGGADAPVVELYRSAHFAPSPYSFDGPAGGYATNYSPPILAQRDLSAPFDEPQQLLLEFSNGAHNLHLQGGNWASDRDEPFELCLRLRVRRAAVAAASGEEKPKK